MLLRRRAVLSVGGCFLLSGCGWHAVYAPGDNGAFSPVQSELSAISVGLIAEHNGVMLRQALQNRFDYTGGKTSARYDLAVYYSTNSEGVGIMPDNSTTRIRLVGTASWTLTAQDPQRTVLTKGYAQSLDGVDLQNGQFFSMDMNTETVQRRMAEAIAQQISLDIAEYFRGKQSKPSDNTDAALHKG